MHLVDEVEPAYCQLEELNRLNTLTMRDVDFVNELLPNHLKVEWIWKYHDMSPTEKVQPFTPFMKFLERERAAVTRLAENQPKPKAKPETSKTGDRGKWQSHHNDSSSCNSTQQRKRYRCIHPEHRRDTINHSTSECMEFQKLPINARFDLLKEVYACFICFGYHRKVNCPNKKPRSQCGHEDHNYLLCRSEKPAAGEKAVEVPKSSNQAHTQAATHASQSASLALYPIQQAKVPESDKSVTIFCDGGSNTTYITHQAADRINAKRLKQFSIDVTTMGNVEKTYDTRQYQFTLRTITGKKVDVTAFDVDKFTGPVSKLDTKVLADLFPDHDPVSLQRKSTLLGCNKLSTPQMELNAAVLSKRGRKVIKKEMRFDFERVLQIVDSETVLNMINKTSTRFKVYEGVRIGEIQAATNGDVS